ncbi:MAG: protein-L-isoaspartate O-methyltransferase [Hyphomonadaceae bacterium]|nr:protein-L-isoaspartate O-methyltransferase [Hyphomonadaceae bacterium]
MGDPARLMRFVLEMRQAGVTDARVLGALERTPRDHYAPEHLHAVALDDVALPLAHGQSMTKPSIVGRVLTALDVQSNHTVLEVGTGSGFQAAALATLAHSVVTLERWPDLAAEARGRIGRARLMRVFVHAADGAVGWEEAAPFDRIVVNAACDEAQLSWLSQLKPGGTLLMAQGASESQRLLRFRSDAWEDLGPIRVAPLEHGLGADA